MTEKIHCHHSSHVQFACDWGNATTILPVHIYIFTILNTYIYILICPIYLSHRAFPFMFSKDSSMETLFFRNATAAAFAPFSVGNWFFRNFRLKLPSTFAKYLRKTLWIYIYILKSWKSFLEVRSGGNSTLHYISLRTPGIPIYALACRTFASKSSAWILFHSMFDQVHSNAKHCSGGEWSWLLEGFSVVRFSEPRSLWRR